MITYIGTQRKHPLYRMISGFVAFTFAFSLITPPGYAQMAPVTILNLPPVGTMVATTAGFTPPLIKGVIIKPDNPMAFDFIVGRGDEDLRGAEFEAESKKMIKYFLAALTIPEEEMWVNLSPYEKDRIIPASFGDTLMGRDLLAQDYMLKQLTASLMYPEEDLGQKFWKRVYKKVYDKYGVTDIPMNTFNKVWIVPEKAVVYERGGSAFVIESHLKVMLEEDYVALEKNLGVGEYGLDSLDQENAEILSGVSSEIVRDLLIPEIEKEVNEGKTFAQLRQIYNSVILASWYKDNLKESLLGQIYVDKAKTKGVDTQDKKINNKIYDQYIQAFKKGVYDYIREDYDPNSREYIPRKYFSGGATIVEVSSIREDVRSMTARQFKDRSDDPVVKMEVWVKGIRSGATSKEIAKDVNRLEAYSARVQAAAEEKETVAAQADRELAMATSSPMTMQEAMDLDVTMLSKDEIRGIFAEIFENDNDVPITFWGHFGEYDDILPKTTFDKAKYGGKGAGLGLMANELPAKFLEAATKKLGVDLDALNSLDIDLNIPEAVVKEIKEKKGLDPQPLFDLEVKLNIPPGFNVSVEQTAKYMKNEYIPEDLKVKIVIALKLLEHITGGKLGTISPEALMLLAVRSGAEESMPGMMDTILNLYLNTNLTEELAKVTDPRFAYDSQRRFIEMFGGTVLGVEENEEEGRGFGVILKRKVEDAGVDDEYALEADDLKALTDEYIEEIIYQGKDKETKVNFRKTENAKEDRTNAVQAMFEAIETVMKSTFTSRAMEYRKKEGLDLGKTISAENILGMIFGNRNAKSGTGVLFSRNTATGKKEYHTIRINGREVRLRVPSLEYAFYAQGEDVVKGRKDGEDWYSLLALAPDMAIQLALISEFLEDDGKEVQDIEFTFEYNELTGKRTLYILQTRRAKRSAQAEIVTAVEMRKEGYFDKETAVQMVSPEKLVELLADRFDPKDIKKALEKGALLSGVGLNTLGAGMGRPVFTSDEAVKYDERRQELIAMKKAGHEDQITDPEDIVKLKYESVLVTEDTAPEDLAGMLKSAAIITSKGGRTSHAAIVAKQFGKAAVVGIKNMHIDLIKGTITFIQHDGTEKVIGRNDVISVDALGDGKNGRIFLDELKTMPSIILTAQYIKSVDIVRGYREQVLKLLQNLNGEDELIDLLKIEYENKLKEYDQFIKEYSDLRKDMLTKEGWRFFEYYTTWMQWADEFRQKEKDGRKGLGVYTNAERWKQMLTAINNGAEGISLFRIEHTYQQDDRELIFQEMILTEDDDLRAQATRRSLPQLQSDVEQALIAFDGKPVIIRLIDPPLHEFLPHKRNKIQELARELLIHEGIEKTEITETMLDNKTEEVTARIEAFAEENSMFGLRGVRLSIVFPEILDMQSTALFTAVKRVEEILGIETDLEIMIPLTGNAEEIRQVKQFIEAKAEELGVKRGNYQIITMAEILANVQNAEAISREVDGVSFGTNDLVQGTYGLNRDGGAEYIEGAVEAGVLPFDPFQSITPEMTDLIARAMDGYRKGNPEKCVGICGEHGGDPTSVKGTFGPIGFTYVGAGPLLVPSAFASAAQANIARINGKTKSVKRKPIPELRTSPKEWRKVNQISDADTLKGQLEMAVAYVKVGGESSDAIANLNFTNIPEGQIADALDYLRENPQIIEWANELKELDIKVQKRVISNPRTDSKSDGVGLITTDALLLDIAIRPLVQEYLIRVRLNISKKDEKEKYDNNEQRKAYLLEEIQTRVTERVEGFVKGLDGVTSVDIRLPDVGLESIFVDSETSKDEVIKDLAQRTGFPENDIKNALNNYKDANPAIEIRGARVFYTKAARLYTNITQGFVRGAQQAGITDLNILLPKSTNAKEVELMRKGYIDKKGKTVLHSLDKVVEQVGENISVKIGADVQAPIAVMSTHEVSKFADFVVISSRDLTERTWSMFTNDARKGFLDEYIKRGILEKDPFDFVPPESMSFIQESVLSVKESNPETPVAIIGNALDVDLITKAHETGADAVIVEDNAYVPIAILAAAQAAVRINPSTYSSPVTPDAIIAMAKKKWTNYKGTITGETSFGALGASLVQAIKFKEDVERKFKLGSIKFSARFYKTKTLNEFTQSAKDQETGGFSSPVSVGEVIVKKAISKVKNITPWERIGGRVRLYKEDLEAIDLILKEYNIDIKLKSQRSSLLSGALIEIVEDILSTETGLADATEGIVRKALADFYGIAVKEVDNDLPFSVEGIFALMDKFKELKHPVDFYTLMSSKPTAQEAIVIAKDKLLSQFSSPVTEAEAIKKVRNGETIQNLKDVTNKKEENILLSAQEAKKLYRSADLFLGPVQKVLTRWGIESTANGFETEPGDIIFKVANATGISPSIVAKGVFYATDEEGKGMLFIYQSPKGEIIQISKGDKHPEVKLHPAFSPVTAGEMLVKMAVAEVLNIPSLRNVYGQDVLLEEEFNEIVRNLQVNYNIEIESASSFYHTNFGVWELFDIIEDILATGSPSVSDLAELIVKKILADKSGTTISTIKNGDRISPEGISALKAVFKELENPIDDAIDPMQSSDLVVLDVINITEEKLSSPVTDSGETPDHFETEKTVYDDSKQYRIDVTVSGEDSKSFHINLKDIGSTKANTGFSVKRDPETSGDAKSAATEIKDIIDEQLDSPSLIGLVDLSEKLFYLEDQIKEKFEQVSSPIAAGEDVGKDVLEEVSVTPIQREGGINLNRAGVDFQVLRDGNGIPFPVHQQPIGDIRIDGVIPFIIQIVPANLPMLLGLADKDELFASDENNEPIESSSARSTDIPGDLSFIDKYRNKFIREWEEAVL